MNGETASMLPVLETVDLAAMVEFCRDQLGLRIDVLSPADAPAEIVMVGATGAVVLRAASRDGGGHLVLVGGDDERRRDPMVAPNGALIELRPETGLIVPPAVPQRSIVRSSDPVTSGPGRAGMTYRDLLPGRWGGRFIASHITIPGGGEVADWVHHHRVRFQLIFCAAGRVEVVYEDQGDPFELEPGDCVLQPPGIRHRVLSSSPGLEVIEFGCPAVHDTIADHDLALPTATIDRDRDFGGQRFVRHRARAARWTEWLSPGWSVCDTAIADATDGLASVRVLRSAQDAATRRMVHDGEIVFHVVLCGSAELVWSDGAGGTITEPIADRDAIAVPAGTDWSWRRASRDFEVLQVALGAEAVRVCESGADR